MDMLSVLFSIVSIVGIIIFVAILIYEIDFFFGFSITDNPFEENLMYEDKYIRENSNSKLIKTYLFIVDIGEICEMVILVVIFETIEIIKRLYKIVRG